MIAIAIAMMANNSSSGNRNVNTYNAADGRGNAGTVTTRFDLTEFRCEYKDT